MSRAASRSWLVRAVIVVVTIALTWGVLLVGQQRSDITLTVGEPSPVSFVAASAVEVTDEEETEAARQQAEEAINQIYTPDPDRTREVLDQIAVVIETAKAGVYREGAPTTTTTDTTFPEPEPTTSSSTQPTTTTTGAEGEQPAPSTTTSEPAALTAGVRGLLFLDADGNGTFSTEAGDAPLVSAAVGVVDTDGQEFQAQTDANGVFTVLGVAVGDVTVTVVPNDVRLEHFATSTDNVQQSFSAPTDTVVEIDDVGFTPLIQNAGYPAASPGGRLSDSAAGDRRNIDDAGQCRRNAVGARVAILLV